jgi:hypothetical protein
MSTEKQTFTYEEAEAFLAELNLDPKEWKAHARRTDSEKLAYGVMILQRTVAHGQSLRTVEKELGIPRATAARYRDKALGAISTPLIEEARKLELERLDALAEAIWPLAATGDDKALNNYLKIMDKKIQMLGLAKPTEINATVTEITPQERELQEMLAQAERDALVKQSELVKDHEDA